MRLPDHQELVDYFSQGAVQSRNTTNAEVAMVTATWSGSPLCCNSVHKLVLIGPPLAGGHVKEPTCRRVRRAPRSPPCHEPDTLDGSPDRWEESHRQSLPTMCNFLHLCGRESVAVGVWLPKLKGSLICQQSYKRLYLNTKNKSTRISLKLGWRRRRGRKGKPS